MESEAVFARLDVLRENADTITEVRKHEEG